MYCHLTNFIRVISAVLVSFTPLLADMPTLLEETVDVGWIRHYGSEQLYSYDEANTVVVDNDGNYYITGLANRGGIVTIKYHPDGSEAWQVAREEGYIYTSYLSDNMAVDAAGNVYVAFEDHTADYGFAVVKYLPDGSQAWTAHHPELTSYGLNLRAFVMDAQGNTYLAGNMSDIDGNFDILIVKFDASGQYAWSAIYDGPVGTDAVNALTVDINGNTYVTGHSRSDGGDWDYCTIKYDEYGNEVWVARYNGEGNDYDIAEAVAVDDVGCVYVTGGSENTSNDMEITTIKYDSAGTVLWIRQYAGDLGDDGYGTHLVFDNEGFVYLGGWYEGDPDSDIDFITIKYDSEGTQLWEQRYNSPAQDRDFPEDLEVDNAGNVYVTGNSASGDGHVSCASTTIKYSPAGEELWVVQSESTTGIHNYCQAMAVDATGRIVITGNAEISSQNWDYFTHVYNSDGTFRRSASYDGPASSLDWSNAMVRDEAGNLYITGGRKNDQGFDSQADCITVKYLPDGSLDWTAVYEGPISGANEGFKIALAPAGDVAVAGTNWTWEGTLDFTTVMYSPAGEVLWIAIYGGRMDPHSQLKLVDLAIDHDGNVIIICVDRENGTDLEDTHYRTIKYDPSGNEIWTAIYEGSGDGEDVPAGLTLDEVGNIYLTGRGFDSDGSYDMTSIKYDPAGEELWVIHYEGEPGSDSYGTALEVDEEANVFVTGSYALAGSSENWITVKYNPEGEEIWSTSYTGPGEGIDIPNVIAIDAASNVYIGGSSEGLQGEDYTTLKYDPSGNVLWEARYDGPLLENATDSIIGHDRITALEVDALGNVYVTGETDYDLGWFIYHGSMMTIRYNPDGSEAWQVLYDELFEDAAHSIAVDGSGNVFVSGSNWKSGWQMGTPHESTFTTIKYVQPEYPVSVLKAITPKSFRLEQNYPNPFNPTTTISYDLPELTMVTLSVFNIRGQEITALQNGLKPSGRYELEWNGLDQVGNPVSTGVYFARLQAGSYSKTIKMLYLK